jgi:hypothetical protein
MKPGNPVNNTVPGAELSVTPWKSSAASRIP